MGGWLAGNARLGAVGAACSFDAGGTGCPVL